MTTAGDDFRDLPRSSAEAPNGHPTRRRARVRARNDHPHAGTHSNDGGEERDTPPRRWPLLVLAAPAFVATWSGWVGLGSLTGFGEVAPLPGIADGFTINTAITLPIGVETYAAYALHAWLSNRRLSRETRRFARTSALASLGLGMAGQVAYHLLTVAGYTTAPWWITTMVSCLPVLVLGMGASLGHMIGRDARAPAVPVAVGDSPEEPARDSTRDSPHAPTRTSPHAPTGTSGNADTAARGDAPTAPRAPVPAANGDKRRDRSGDRSGDSRTTRKRTSRKPGGDTLDDARAAVAHLIGDGQPVSRAMLRTAGVAGSNQRLSEMAEQLNAERTENRDQETTLAA